MKLMWRLELEFGGLSSGGIYKCVHMYIAERKAEAMNEFSSRTNCLLEFSVYRRPI